VDSSAKVVTNFSFPAPKVAQVAWDSATNTITPDTQLPSWVLTSKLVAKPDQLIKRRGKAGLLALNKNWDEAKEWIAARAGKPQKVSGGRHPKHFECLFSFWGGGGGPCPWIWLGQGRDTYNWCDGVSPCRDLASRPALSG
jgi:hypothetical protein